MTEEAQETLSLNGETDAPAEIESEATDVVTEVEDELKGAEPSDSSTEEKVAEDKPKADPVQKRIDELTRKRRDAERDSEYWRDQAMKRQPEAPVEPVEQPLQTLADFDYDEGRYQQHLFKLAQDGAVQKAQEVMREEQSQQSSKRKVTEFRSRENDFSKNVEDYREVVTNPDLSLSKAMVDVATDMENGPEVLYYLAKNPDLSDEIAHLPPLTAARELGRIEAKLQSQAKSGEKVSKAPAPAPKISGLDPSVGKNPDEMSQKEWNAHRRKIIANR